MLHVKVGVIDGVETLFAISEYEHPLGVAVFFRSTLNRIVVLHLGVLPCSQSNNGINAQVLLELVQKIHRTARSTQGVDRIEVVYSRRNVAPIEATNATAQWARSACVPHASDSNRCRHSCDHP
jgi:hypothetical protein